MPIEFYAREIQPVLGPVFMLPQRGSVSGGSNRPMNSYAIQTSPAGRRETVLLDAPFSWTMEGVRAMARSAPISAHVLSHRDLLFSGDAFEQMDRSFDAPFLLHPDDLTDDEAKDVGVELHDPTDHKLITEAGLDVIHMPGHTPGSILIFHSKEGILLTGDSAVGPGPEQEASEPTLQRPKMEEDATAEFIDAFERLMDLLPPLQAVLPLHGAWYCRKEIGSEAFERAIANIWQGDPMDPSGDD